MNQNLGKLLVGASMAIGLGVVAATPAQAGSLTGATIGGTAASDYDVYVVQGNNTKLVTAPNNKADFLQEALTGDAASPTGNIELRASTEENTFTPTEFGKNTTLEGQIGGKNITLSSLILSDWTTTYKNTGKTFGRYWFDSALTANGLGSLFGTQIGNAIATEFFNIFQNNGGFQRFSDPNISYVNQNDTTGLISIGLAGNFNATSLLLPYFDTYVSNLPNGLFKNFVSGLRSELAATNLRASEIVKYTYNDTSDYLFSFNATSSGLTEYRDGQSHNGNYEVTIAGVSPTQVPEPSVMLGVLGIAGVFAAQRKLKKASV